MHPSCGRVVSRVVSSRSGLTRIPHGPPAAASYLATEFREKCGLTLLEVVVYAGLLAVIGGPLVSVLLVSSRGVAEHSTMNYVAERNLVSLYRVTQEVRTCLSDTVTVTNGGKSLTFTLPDGYDGTSVVAGATIRYDFVLSPEETANGIDDNGNGLVDEGLLARTNVTTATTETLCENLHPDESSFAWDSSTVSVTLATVGQLPSVNSIFGITRTLALVPRN